MPNNIYGRDLVKKWADENDISLNSIASVYGMTRQEVSNYINGTKKGPKANLFILRLIEDYKIK